MVSMLEIQQAIGLIFVGVSLVGCYRVISVTEPFCYYLPGGLGKLYKLHCNIKTRYSDVIGNAEIKKMITETVAVFRQDPITTKYSFMFRGPPGTGKTFTAQAIAGECGLPFIEILSRDQTRDIMPTVINTVIKNYAPCIIFIDEAHDLLGFNRDYIIRLLDSMTACKDKVIFIFATNRSQEIDESIMRHKRIDKVINFDKPTKLERLLHVKAAFPMLTEEQVAAVGNKLGPISQAQLDFLKREYRFIQQHRQLSTANGSIAGAADDTIASTERRRGSDIDDYLKVGSARINIATTNTITPTTTATINIATITAEELMMQDIYGLIEKLQMGYHNQDLKTEINADNRRRLAIHELGHAMVAFLLKQSLAKPSKISLNSAGAIAGYNIVNYNDSTVIWTKQQLSAVVATCLAGYVAEKHFYQGDTSTMVAADLTNVAALLDQMSSNLMIRKFRSDYDDADDNGVAGSNSNNRITGRRSSRRKHGRGGVIADNSLAANYSDLLCLKPTSSVASTTCLSAYDSQLKQIEKFLLDEVFKVYHDDIVRLADQLELDNVWEEPCKLASLFAAYTDKLDMLLLD